mmetsp:Transcript_41289/g.89437  ORF Transcript_41289/g.89437 Transcript_41289/m.89437 type:complete len:233 (+) Transcript_41289:62-760(+)
MAYRVVLALACVAQAAQLATKASGNWWPFADDGELPSDVKALVSAASGDEARPKLQEQRRNAVQPQQSPHGRLEGLVALQQPAMEVTRHSSSKPAEEYDVTDSAGGAETVLSALLESKEVPQVPVPVSPKTTRRPLMLATKSTGQPDQLSQCLDFAQWAKHQEIRGKELTKLFMSTCSPSASAPKKYVDMCKGMESEMKVLEKDEDWLPAAACDVLLKYFRRSQVGSNPLED